MKNVRPIWKILIVIFLLISIPLGIIALRLTIDFRSNAGPTEEPQEVIVSNITDTSAVVSFMTPSVATRATVSILDGESVSFDERSIDATESYNVHYHRFSNLDPDTIYTYTITTGEESYTDPNFTFTTFPTSDEIPTPKPLNGRVTGTFTEGIVYTHLTDGIENSTVASALIPSSGAYALDIGTAKKITGEAFDNASDIIIFASAAGDGKGFSTTEITETSAPAIELIPGANDYDPTNLGYLNGTEPTLTEEIAPVDTVEATIMVTEEPEDISLLEIDATSKSLLTQTFTLPEANSNSEIPSNIFISNPSTTSFTVNWTTKVPTTGSIIYAKNTQNLSKRTLDKRDGSEINQIPRYTHSVDIIDSTIVSGDVVYFKLISNDFEISNSGNNFAYTPPVLQGSPPAPTSQDGTINPTFAANANNRDFLIATKVNNNSTWISNVTGTNNNWNVALGSALDSDLEGYSDITNANLNFTAYGEQNSRATKVFPLSDTPVIIDIDPGLTVEEQDQVIVLSGGEISGTANPNASVSISVNSSPVGTTRAGTNGNWTFQLPSTVQVGTSQIEVRAGSENIIFNVEIQEAEVTPTPTVLSIQDENLPTTGIGDWLIYLPGIFTLWLGIRLLVSAKKNFFH